MHLFTGVFLAGLLIGLFLDALTLIFSPRSKHAVRMTVLFIISIFLFIVSLFMSSTLGTMIGFLSLGIYTTALLLALFGICRIWRMRTYYGIVIFVVCWFILSLFR
ncbi:hypothetical protein [Rummeliibacillus stabekisii]|uniref:hypothetical protein n=1 Tax=Rummeliibacillus stabekisii TaxID=241244 RepID=UPI0011BE38EA|nr:hypothetical protein [Rummeliibacillus stabekisii]MBB5168651.1 asparagine N-glycosylation enzyme membrane subunit Stt3 [Rummeliibacillus stabekisii]